MKHEPKTQKAKTIKNEKSVEMWKSCKILNYVSGSSYKKRSRDITFGHIVSRQFWKMTVF